MAQTVAILSAKGIGDALLMMISAYQFKQHGYTATFYHEKASLIAPLFPSILIKEYPPLPDIIHELKKYEIVILENDHSEIACSLLEKRIDGLMEHLIGFFPKNSKYYLPCDFLFDISQSMVTNIAIATKDLLGLPCTKTDNGICISCNHIYRRYPRRVLLHPTSANPIKNWTLKQFKKLADQLIKIGFDPVFIMSIEEKKQLKEELANYKISTFEQLQEMGNYIYESGFFIGNDSGFGHLASNMSIPTITICASPRQIKLWRPNWYMGKVISPIIPLPNFKGIGWNFRERYWQRFVTVCYVMKVFIKLSYTA